MTRGPTRVEPIYAIGPTRPNPCLQKYPSRKPMEKKTPKYLRATALKETEGDPYSDLMDELEKSLQESLESCYETHQSVAICRKTVRLECLR
jgi:hypothetical protein